jgi:quercetin dioxygenase-like cupin family protein
MMLMKGSAGCAVPSHWHISNEQIMMLRGTARAQVRGDRDVVLRGGDYFFVPPSVLLACAACTTHFYDRT